MATDYTKLYDALYPRLREPVKRGDNILSLCPAHPDGAKSGKNGRSLELNHEHGLRCFAGCSYTDILSAFGVDVRDVQGETDSGSNVVPFGAPIRTHRTDDTAPRGMGEPDHVYEYRDETGTLIATKARWNLRDGGKTFRWKTPTGSYQEGIKATHNLSDLPLWGTDLVAKADPATPVIFCEGEKATEACRARGLLAVCAGGGSSQKDFGTALDVLRGRDLILWPDNDETGRKYAAVIRAKLRGLARSIRTLTVDVPAKGDAFDYFAAGGTWEAATAGTVTRPVTEFVAKDCIRVKAPTEQEMVAVLTFSRIEKTVRDLNAELEVALENTSELPYTQRINLLSANQRELLRRELDQMFGNGHGWTKVLNHAFVLVRDGFMSQDVSVDAADITDLGMPGFQIDTFVPAASPSIIFGDGSGSKTWQAMVMALCVATGTPYLEQKVEEGRVLWVDYETNEQTFRFRLDRVARGLGLPGIPPGRIRYLPARGIPMADLVDYINMIVERDDIRFMIVDSAGPACGGEPEKAEVAISYFNALAKIGITSLTIAHVAKRDPKAPPPEYPFGSIFWHNAPRRTWYVKREQEEDSPVVKVGVFCKKVNDGRKPHAIHAIIKFEDPDGPVIMHLLDTQYGSGHEPAPPAQEPEDPNTIDRIVTYLASAEGYKATTPDVMKALGLKEWAVRAALKRGSDKGGPLVAIHQGTSKNDPSIWGLTNEALLAALTQTELELSDEEAS